MNINVFVINKLKHPETPNDTVGLQIQTLPNLNLKKETTKTHARLLSVYENRIL